MIFIRAPTSARGSDSRVIAGMAATNGAEDARGIEARVGDARGGRRARAGAKRRYKVDDVFRVDSGRFERRDASRSRASSTETERYPTDRFIGS